MNNHLSSMLRDTMSALDRLGEALRAREGHLAWIERIGAVASFEIDVSTGAQTTLTDAFRRMHGLEPAATAETHAQWLARVHSQDRERADRALREALSGGTDLYHSEYRIVPPDGSTRWIRAVGEVERNDSGRATRLVGAHLDVTDQVTLTAELNERREAQATITALARRVISAQEDERQRIAREMHDQLGQELTALRLQLQVLGHAVEDQADATLILERCQALTANVDGGIDRIIRDLRPEALDRLGFHAALRELAANWTAQTGIPTDCCGVEAATDTLPNDVRGHLYRLVQETLNNVSRHAHATRVVIAFRIQDGLLQLGIADDGRGVEMSDPRVRRGLGFVSMRERAALIGAAVQMHSAPGVGTTITVGLQTRLPAIGRPPDHIHPRWTLARDGEHAEAHVVTDSQGDTSLALTVGGEPRGSWSFSPESLPELEALQQQLRQALEEQGWVDSDGVQPRRRNRGEDGEGTSSQAD